MRKYRSTPDVARQPRTHTETPAVVIRLSQDSDDTALHRLAALDSRTLPNDSFVLAEVGGEVVAAAALSTETEPISDPFRPTAEVRELLALRVRHMRPAVRAA